MTNHSIEELRRQANDAKSKLQDANVAFLAAEKRLHDAMTRDTGFMGKIFSTNKGREFVVNDVEFLCGKPFRLTGFGINKDGKVGFGEVYAHVDDVMASLSTPVEQEKRS